MIERVYIPTVRRCDNQITFDNLPKELIKLGEFSISGYTKITPSAIEAALKVNSEIGSIVSDLELNNFKSMDEAIYKGEVVLDRFDLGDFFEDSSFGSVSFEGEVDGLGFRAGNRNTKLVGEIYEIKFNEYNYKNISINGLYKNNLFG